MNKEAEERAKGLFGEFPPVDTVSWEKQIHEDLKGADYEKKLLWKAAEGFTMRPYYRKEDLEGLEHLRTQPGVYPFVRGKSPSGNPWRIRQDILVRDLKAANEKALDILMKGIDSLGFVLDEQHSYTRDEIDMLLRNIHAHAVELNFLCGEKAPDLVRIIDQLVKDYNRDLEQIHGAVDYAPLDRLITRGRFAEGEEEAFRKARDLMELAGHLPHFRVISVHGSHFQNAGANLAQELGFALSEGNEYLARITSLGVSVTQVAPRIRFNFATGSDYFMEMAKYRAARLLWARIVTEYGGDEASCRMNIRAVTSTWNKTVYDIYTNMLRTTTEAMSAILGGVDSLTIGAYDAVLGDASEFGERIARNQQLLLREESYLDKVADPAAGSYYIENLTDRLASAAWDLFREVEAEGGFLEAVRKGKVQQQIMQSAEFRNQSLATRKAVLIGTNQYPAFQEQREQPLKDGILEPCIMKEPDAEVEVLSIYRGAQAFEKLRYQVDRTVMAGGRRPEVFLLNYGNLAMRKARANFASNFFACAGFSIIDPPGFATVEEGIHAAKEAKAPFTVICSSDEEYAGNAVRIYQALQQESHVIVAGYPRELLDEMTASGLKDFIHVRSNLLESLSRYVGMISG